MNVLAVELLKEIFQSLHQRDKVECLTVCRAWKEALENTILFKTIRLHTNDQLAKLVTKLHLNPTQSHMVERIILEIKNPDNREIEIDILPYVIHSIRHLTFYGDTNNPNHDMRFTKMLTPHPWAKTVKSIREPSSQVFTSSILKGGSCLVLEEITICGKEKQPGKELITLLENAPALKSLSLKNYSLSIADLELLHDKLPLLSSLALKEILIYSDTLPTAIKPTNSVTNLSLEKVHTLSTTKYIEFQKYAIIKYPKVANMFYCVIVDSDFNYENVLNFGFIPQLRQIAPYLTSFDSPCSKHIQYALPVLDQNRCQLREYTAGSYDYVGNAEIGHIVRSKQAQYIQKLSLYVTLSGISLEHFSKFPLLTVLSITYQSNSGKQTIDINHLLEIIGNTLLNLELTNTTLLLDPFSVSKCTSLTTLILKKTVLPRCIDTFIAQTFPKLHTVIIDDCTFEASTLYLGDLNLTYLEFRYPFPPKRQSVLVVTLHNNKKRCYSAQKVSVLNPHPSGDPSHFPAVNSWPLDESAEIPYMTFLCHSVREFFMVNTLS